MFIFPDNVMTEFESIKNRIPCTCGEPAWYSEYHIAFNRTHTVQCANCFKRLLYSNFVRLYNSYKLPSKPQLVLSKDDIKYEFNAIEKDRVLQDIERIPCTCGQIKWTEASITADLPIDDIYIFTSYVFTCMACGSHLSHEHYYNNIKTKKFKPKIYSDWPKPISQKQQTKPGRKFDAHKNRVSLIKRMGLALLAISDLTTKGAIKYDDHNWVKLENGINRYDDALFRHYLKESFEPKDPEMQIPHEVATAWNALVKLQLLIEKDAEWKWKLLKGE